MTDILNKFKDSVKEKFDSLVAVVKEHKFIAFAFFVFGAFVGHFVK